MRSEFISGLKAMGIEATDLDGTKLTFPYRIPLGKFMGREVTVGLEVSDMWPATPPSGPHFMPHLLPISPGGVVPLGGINASPFGEGWQYWSRPHTDWHRTDRSVGAYLAFIRRVLDFE